MEVLPGIGQGPANVLRAQGPFALQPVAQAGHGLDVIALPLQGLHRLPYRCPGNAQLPAQGLPGEVPLRLG